MKKIILATISLFLIGCVNKNAGHSKNQVDGNKLAEDISSQKNKEAQEDIQETSEEEKKTDVVESNQVRDNGLPYAWTDFSSYAHVDEEGFAYEIHKDPDISSEIFPLNEESSSDILLFTFDDAPQAPDSYALEIAKTLKAKDVNAIFLVNGMYLEDQVGRDITKEIYELGFEIGNHTQYHLDLSELSYEEQYAEIKETNDLIKEITGASVRWFRPPFGLFNMDTVLICNELDLQLITWSFGYDWMDEYLDGPSLAQVSIDNPYIRGGANILMHDRPWTLEALETMVDGYREMGYHIVDPYLIKHQENSTEVHNLANN